MLINKSMFQRKTVIFQIEKGNRIITEFNENTTLNYLKIYIRDRTNIKKFDLYLQGKPVKNYAIPLYKFFRNRTDKIIKFYLKVYTDNTDNDKLKSNNKEILNLHTYKNKYKNNEKFKLYEQEISFVKERNDQLINNINKYKANITESIKNENRNKEKYNSIESLLAKQKEKIDLLKKQINIANTKYNKLHNQSMEKENRINQNKLKYTESSDNFEIISKNPKPKKCLSVESFNAMYPREKKNYAIKSINLTSENIKKERGRESADSTNVLSSSMDNNQLKISTKNISNKDNLNENDLDIININQLQNSRNEKKIFSKKDSNKNINTEIDHSPYYSNDKSQKEYKYQIKEYNTNELKSDNSNKSFISTSKISQDSMDNIEQKEEDSIDFNKIMNNFNTKNDIKPLLSKEELLNKDSLNLPASYDIYNSVFKFLNESEILSFSIINKLNGVSVLYHWMNILKNKIKYLEDNYTNLVTKYNSLNEKLNSVESKSNSILSYFSKSGLRVLNSPHYLDIYNNTAEYFIKDPIFLFIYKMLFQFIKLYDESKNISDEDFVTLMENEIKEKTSEKKSLREYIYILLDKEIDFTFENVMKAKNIMKKYNMENIEGNQISKIDRASAIIGHVIKDIMGFTGLVIKTTNIRKGSNLSNKKEEEDISFSSLKNKIINSCEQINTEKIKCENIIKKIKEIIIKYYNF